VPGRKKQKGGAAPIQTVKQAIQELKRWQKLVSRLPGATAAEGALRRWLDRLCGSTDRIVAWCNDNAPPHVSASPLIDFKEMYLATLRIPPGQPDRPTPGQLTRQWGRANGAVTQLLAHLESSPAERLVFDRDTLTITLDGLPHPNLDPTAFRILEAIRAESPEKASSKQLLEQPGLRGKNIDRELRKLPEELRAVVQGSSGSGRWIALPPLPS
jgi:hypothetical protein